MTDSRPGPRQVAEVASHQHKTLAWVTASTIKRLAREMEEDFEHGRPVNVGHAKRIARASLVLVEEAIAAAIRFEDAARMRDGAAA